MRYPKHLSALVAYHVQCRAQSSLHAPFVPWSPNPMPRRMFLLGLPPRTLFESLATLALLLAVTRRARTVPVVLYARTTNSELKT